MSKNGHKYAQTKDDPHLNEGTVKEDAMAEGSQQAQEDDVYLVNEGDNMPPPDPLVKPFVTSPKKEDGCSCYEATRA